MNRRGIVVGLLTCALANVSPAVPAEDPRARCKASDPAVTYGSGFFPEAVLIADVTGDGLNDFLQSNPATDDGPFPNTVAIYEQHRYGHFDAPRILPTDPSGHSTRQRMGLATADFDGDSMRDIAVATGSGVDLFFGSDDFSSRHLVEIAGANLLTARDFDGDDRPDLVVATDEGVRFVRIIGQDAYEVTEVSSDVAIDMEAGDVTGDGRPDAVLAVEQGMVVLSRRDDGSFTRVLHEIELSAPSTATLAVGDLTRDARADVAFFQAAYVFFEQTADGNLEMSERSSSVRSGPRVVADWDGDGHGDLVSVIDSSSTLQVAFDGRQANGGCGYQLFSPTTQQRGLAVGDLNGDRWPDAVLSGATVLQQRRTPLVVPQATTLRPFGRGRRAEVTALSLDLTAISQANYCDHVVVVERFANGRWKPEMGPTEISYDMVGKLPRKPGAYRAVVRKSRSRHPIDVDCPTTVSPYVGSAQELRRAGCDSVASSRTLRLPSIGNDLAAGDFNSDGLTDVAVALVAEEGDAEAVVYHAGEDGRLGNPVELAPGGPGGEYRWWTPATSTRMATTILPC